MSVKGYVMKWQS